MQQGAASRADARGRRVASILALALLAGCQNLPASKSSLGESPGCKRLGGNTNTKNAAIGAAGGAVVGAVLGGALANKGAVGARNGLLFGALGGALAGSQYNKVIGMSEQPDGSVKLDIPGAVMFKSGSAEVSPEFGSTLASVGNTMREYCGLTATVIGHTDNVGGAEMNQRLSQDRANAVVAYLAHEGVQAAHLRAEGRGLSQPVATNDTDAGRAQNRRVEIFVKPSDR